MALSYTHRVGGATVTYTVNDAGMKDMITDSMFLPTLMKHAEESKVRAEAAAEAMPTRHWGRHGSQRRTQRHYKDSFDTEAGYGVTIDGTPRIRARVLNSNPFAIYIEYGNSNIKPARRILRTAAGINRFDAQGDKY